LVAFLRRHRATLAREDTLQWLLGVLLSAVARPGRAQVIDQGMDDCGVKHPLSPPPPSQTPNTQAALKSDLGARAGVAHILDAGLCRGAPEQVRAFFFYI
jgi:hypothetical protein